MKVIKPSYQILNDIDGITILKCLERIGRVCYKSEKTTYIFVGRNDFYEANNTI